MADTGDTAGAEAEYRALRAAFAAQLGQQHPETFRVHSFIIVLLKVQEKWYDALRECQALLSAMTDALGAAHPDTLAIGRELVYLRLRSST